MDHWFIYSYSDCRLIHNQYLTDSHPTVHRYTGNTLPMLSWPTVSRFCWLMLDRELNITRPTYRPTVGDADCQPIHHQYLTSTWPGFTDTLPTRYWCYLLTDTQPTGKWLSTEMLVDTWSTVYRLSADISVESQLSIGWHSSRYIDRQSTQMLADTSNIPPKWHMILDLFILYVFVFPVKVSGELFYPLCLFIIYAYIT